MLNSFQIFFLFVIFSQFILGTWGNGFLGLINCIHWIKRSKISLPDFIIMNLAFSRIFLQCVIVFDATTLVLYPDFYCGETLIEIRETGWTLSNYLSIWLFTCLSVFYCLKIAIFSHPAFLWLKKRISQVVACILLGCVLFFFFSTLLLIQKFNMYSGLRKMMITTNYTESFRKKEREFFISHLLGLLWTVIPFLISLFSCLLLILSLRRHTRMMHHHVTTSRDVSTKAHERATIVMFSFLLLFVFYFVIVFIGTAGAFLPDAKVVLMITLLVAPLFPSVNSFILILQNKNLKQAFLGLLWLKKGCMKAARLHEKSDCGKAVREGSTARLAGRETEPTSTTDLSMESKTVTQKWLLQAQVSLPAQA
ncbi:taste receptor type 2 member 3-like [Vombatus ursinus]|uniref:taste receptor type 2 member 3-like n=1 Tax=Vombatus ursinus TaxID=29139 RepID=UPI000FFDA5E9|nr:taste receptor type 2 member 3-like [Vombatus ursinus]